jgi:hypothetical protein
MGAPAARGAALIDVVFTAGLVAVLSGIAIPLWHSARQHGAARAVEWNAVVWLVAPTRAATVVGLRRLDTVFGWRRVLLISGKCSDGRRGNRDTHQQRGAPSWSHCAM